MPRFKLVVEYAGGALQRLADSEERADGAGRDRARGARGDAAVASSSCTAPAGPTPACTRSPRSRTSSSTRICRRKRCARGPTTRCRTTSHRGRSTGCRTASTRGTMRVSRSYLYQISRRKTAFFKPYVWWVKERLDVDAMRAAAGRVRRHARFRVVHRRRARREVDEACSSIDSRSPMTERCCSSGSQGSHFLWRMVRRLVGVLAAVGRGELTPGDAAGFLDERSNAPRRVDRPRVGPVPRRRVLQERKRDPDRCEASCSFRPTADSQRICGRFTIGTNRTGIVARVSRRSPCRRETTSS